jgi:hypothetical protein
MAWYDYIAPVANIVSPFISSMAAKGATNNQLGALNTAAGIQSTAGKNALAYQKDAYGNIVQNTAPYMQTGQNALAALNSGMGFTPPPGTNALAVPGSTPGNLTQDFGMADFEKDPGFQFRLEQGRKAIEAKQAQQGKLLGPAGAKELIRYNQDASSGEFQNAYNRFMAKKQSDFNMLSSMAGYGTDANHLLASAGQNFGTNAAGLAMNQGNTQADLAMQAGGLRGAGAASQGNIWAPAAAYIGQNLLDSWRNARQNQIPVYGSYDIGNGIGQRP